MKYKAIILLLFVLFLLTVACKKAVDEKESLVETMAISADCATDQSKIDNCCFKQCTDFCEGKDHSYFKHDINGNTCLCWCD